MRTLLLHCLTILFITNIYAGISINGEFKVATKKQFQQNISGKFTHLKVSDKLEYKISKYTLRGTMHTGSLEGKPGSQFVIISDERGIKGYIIVSAEKNTEEVYQYTTNSNDDVVLKAVTIDHVLCTEYSAFPKNTNTNSTTATLGGEIAGAMPLLNSLLGSSNVVLLDFDGHNLPSGTVWNNGNAINATPSGFSDAQITQAWGYVVEDYAPFDVNITTDEQVYQAADPKKRMRVVITTTSSWYAGGNAGGGAQIGSFDWGTDVPCYVFVNNLSNSPWNVGECCSHEVGHTVNLLHDGHPNGQYYYGHGIWAPIMGSSYNMEVSQFSIGEYTGANNQQDDFQTISGYLPFLADNHGNTTSAAVPIKYTINGTTGTIATTDNEGLINNRNDVDVFKISSFYGGNVELFIKPSAMNTTNVDLEVKLYDSSNKLIVTNGTGHTDLMNGAYVNTNLTAGEVYYLFVDGVGTGNPVTGWSDYASVGPYTISGTIQGVQPLDYDIAVTDISGISAKSCGNSVAPLIEIKNVGSQTITQMFIEVLLDNNLVESKTLNGSWPIGSSYIFNANTVQIMASGNHTISARVSQPNGVADQENSNDNKVFSFNIGLGQLVSFKISEASVDVNNMVWTIKENNTTFADNYVTATSSGGFRVQDFCLIPNKCYDLSVSNAFVKSCNQYSNWVSSKIYNAGDKFLYNGTLYEAKVQIWNANPASYGQYYNNLGPCSTINMSDYFAITDPGLQQELIKQTAGSYSSPYSGNFCVTDIYTSVLTEKNSPVQIFPNPTTGVIYLSEQAQKVLVCDISGQQVKVYNQIGVFDISDLADGVYFVSIENGNQQIVCKLIKL